MRTGLHSGTNAPESEREELRRDRETLRALYRDYDARHHDMFVLRYIKELEDKALHDWMRARGIE